MISCTRLAVPGVIVSMLLAGQAFASSRPPADEEAVVHKLPPASVEQKKPVTTRAQARRGARSRLERQAKFVETDPLMDGVKAGPARWKQIGIASWYGGARWQGHRTASGERYDEHELTAAHASLPLGSKVLVSSQVTGRSVIVTINDRPGTRKRVIDLSYEAAKELGLLGSGTALVTLTPL
jgi:rare lipoprotein A